MKTEAPVSRQGLGSSEDGTGSWHIQRANIAGQIVSENHSQIRLTELPEIFDSTDSGIALKVCSGWDTSDLKLALWKKYGLEDQSLSYGDYGDGLLINLSCIWDVAEVYQYVEASNSTVKEYHVVSTGRSIALAIFVLIFFVGIVGNALVVYTVIRYVTMRRVTYLYLLNLAVADLQYLLVCLPTLSVSYALVDWRFGRAFCKLENYIMLVSMSVSVLTITATGLDRYIAVIYPIKSRTLRTTKITVSVICFTWIISLAIMAPKISIYDLVLKFHLVGLITLCDRVLPGRLLQLDTSLNFVFMYLLPLLVLCVCHSRIGRRLWTSRRPGNAASNRGQMGLLVVQDRRRIAKIVFAITIVFAIGWLPIHVYHLVEDFDTGNILFGEVMDRGTIALFFSFGANALNPIFYCMFSGSFRKHFKEVFSCWNKRIVTSTNLNNVASLRVQLAHTEGQQCRLPPQVLLPRPASLLSDSVSSSNAKPDTSQKLASATNSTFLLLQKDSELPGCREESRSDICSECSPLSVKKVAHIEVSGRMWTHNEKKIQDQGEIPPLTFSSIGVCPLQDIPVRYGHHRRSTSFSYSEFARFFTRTEAGARPKSVINLACGSKELPTCECSTKENSRNLEILERNAIHEISQENIGDCMKKQRQHTSPGRHLSESSSKCAHSLWRRRTTNSKPTDKICSVSTELLERPMTDRNGSLVTDSSDSLTNAPSRDKKSVNKLSHRVTEAKILKCDNELQVHVGKPSLVEHFAKTNLTTLLDSSLAALAANHHSLIRANNSRATNPAHNLRDNAKQKDNVHNTMPRIE